MSGQAYRRWICDACGFIYDEKLGDPDSGLAPGTRYEDIADDWQCPLCGLSKSDLRLLPEPNPAGVSVRTARKSVAAKNKCRGGPDYIVIIGAGVAGWSAAEQLRKADPDRPVLLVTACEGLVYPKPALSIALAQGRQADDIVEKNAITRAEELGIDVRTETRIIKIDPLRKRITSSKGGIEYDTLVLATGAHQRALTIAGDAAGSIMRVNDLASYRQLRKSLDGDISRVMILGAGLIGCEFADDMIAAGYTVSVIDPASLPLINLLPDSISSELRTRLQSKGVSWHFHAQLQQLQKSATGLLATLSTGEQIETDLVLSAAGLIANTALANKAGISVTNGIAVDSNMRTSAPDIYALGDCASIDGRIYAYIEPIHRQARAIAAAISGGEDPFMSTPPLIRVKTPTLPLSICNPIDTDQAHWKNIEHSEDGCHMEYAGKPDQFGFILSGSHARHGPALYRRMMSPAV